MLHFNFEMLRMEEGQGFQYRAFNEEERVAGWLSAGRPSARRLSADFIDDGQTLKKLLIPL